jgi:hypothetical protein
MGLAEGDIDLDDHRRRRDVAASPCSTTPPTASSTSSTVSPTNCARALDQALTAALLDQHFALERPTSPTAAPGVRTGVRGDRRRRRAGHHHASCRPTPRRRPGRTGGADRRPRRRCRRRRRRRTGVRVDLVQRPALPGRFEAADMADARDELPRRAVESDAAVVDAKRGLDSVSTLEAEPAETRGLVYWYYVARRTALPGEAWDAAARLGRRRGAVDRSANGVCVDGHHRHVDEGARVAMRDAINAGLAAGAVEAQAPRSTEIGTDQLRLFSCDPGPTDADTVRNDVVPRRSDRGTARAHAAIGEVARRRHGPDAEPVRRERRASLRPAVDHPGGQPSHRGLRTQDRRPRSVLRRTDVRSSVAEVLELQRDAEIGTLQQRDHGLQVVALLAL